jgi:hypothetical protein
MEAERKLQQDKRD